jgi:hypothetical protein
VIISIHDVWNDAAASHENYVRKVIAKSLKKLLRVGPPSQALFQALSFVVKHQEEIVLATSRDYAASVADYDACFPAGTSVRAQVGAILEAIFNYDKFRDATRGWSAYSLCVMSPYVVCPYCHLVPTNTEIKTGAHKGYRPQLDHFIGKATYPFLALSLGNLVPCCATCNGPSMKHSTDVLKNPHLFPLVDQETLRFKLRPKNGKAWSPMLRAAREPYHKYEIDIEAPMGNVAAQNSMTTFQLRSRYQSYLHDAYRLAKVGRNPAWIRTITSVLGFAPSLEDQLGFSNNVGGTDFKYIPQGKMRLDIYDDSRTW